MNPNVEVKVYINSMEEGLEPWAVQLAKKLKETLGIYVIFDTTGLGNCIYVRLKDDNRVNYDLFCWTWRSSDNELLVAFDLERNATYPAKDWDTVVNLLVELVRLVIYRLTNADLLPALKVRVPLRAVHRFWSIRFILIES
ncbi:hypothetical protein CM19_00770 [Candidatus Acidianus copahuensis]|uniref:Uncharacterized protein n=1 Tax=Candidatus Acidianus copahuensis TaxID=1160895 RepID=A0A031LVN9_9CREN|nr:hypothetical protein [Candidatus Acidianus copahuensis]EZQ11539.1 hypothetical protein CM19_00770 [Candidatus Acidianus copahuensis]